jgi:hypothetical protein
MSHVRAVPSRRLRFVIPAMEPRWMTVGRWIVLGFLALVAIPALLSGYRAWVQVYRLDLVSAPVLRAGSVVRANVVTSGRAYAELRIELVQGAQVETLATRQVPANRDAPTDPRPQRATLAAGLPPQIAARFAPGAAVLRATATGRSQWLRTPPPTVREIAVHLQR